jgi:C1A family cysteine protease
MRLGWIPDVPDHRDFAYQVAKPSELPAMVDLRDKMPPIYDQGELGSCSANAIAAAFEYEQVRRGLADFMPSRLFIYYNERKMEGTIPVDAGATIRNGIKSVNKVGVVSEVEIPYDEHNFAAEPSQQNYANARFHRSVQYQRVTQNVYTLRHCLANGNPFTFGFMMYESFVEGETEKSGVVYIPRHGEAALGGHAVLAVGYLTVNHALFFICRNSWSDGWGDRGHFYMPAEYLADDNLSDDLWTIQAVGGLQQ